MEGHQLPGMEYPRKIAQQKIQAEEHPRIRTMLRLILSLCEGGGIHWAECTIASFVSGVVIAMVCLFWIEPLGEITYSAVSIVSELLVLCGAILGVKASIRTSLRQSFGTNMN